MTNLRVRRRRPKILWFGAACGVLILGVLLACYLVWSFNTFRFSGTVVDERGRLLEDVLLEVLEARSKKMGFETDYKEKVTRIDGTFATSVWRADSVDLIFYSSGYEPVRLHFDAPSGHHGLRVVMKQK